jgi:excinuclease ABC subunit B
VRYLHSDIDSLTRIDILKDLRKGAFDVLVGINLLREGLDLPEVSLVAILDAANEGFLRSETTLIQIAGRAARNVNGQVILYADARTGSMTRALAEMDRRREKQLEHNKEHGITPTTIVKAVHELEEFQYEAKRQGLSLLRDVETGPLSKESLPRVIEEVERRMNTAADSLDFELAAVLRDQLFELKGMSPVGAKRSSQPPKARRRKR